MVFVVVLLLTDIFGSVCCIKKEQGVSLIIRSDPWVFIDLLIGTVFMSFFSI